MKERETFGSFGALMAMAGSAVGLGNLWRFPYLVGQNGGAAFILVYIVFVVLIAMPIFFAEFLLGRRGRSNCAGAFNTFAPGTKWKWAGILSVVAPALIVSYYSVIGGWSFQYLLKACEFEFNSAASQEHISTMFSDFVASVWPPLLGFLIFITGVAYVTAKGVKKGIERFGNVAMPVLFFIVIGIAVYTGVQPGAAKGYEYLFKPDFSKLTAQSYVDALGQAFYSLSLGCCCILTYASYVKRKDNMMRHCVSTSLIDLGFALIAGCAIMPAVFANGVNPGQGPSLVYETLPFIFSRMPGGNVVAIVFFVGLLAAAITSAISMYEVVVAYIAEEFKISRKKSVWLVWRFAVVLGALCSLSFGPLKNVKLGNLTIFDICDKLTSNVLMIMGALLIVIFVGWKMKRSDVMDELNDGGASKHSPLLLSIIYNLIRFVAPVAIIAIFICGLLL